MKPTFILGNWKANKTLAEAQIWVKEFGQKLISLPENIKLIICPAFHHLYLFNLLPAYVALGVQDLSAFPSGSYTGEISAPMLKGLVKYALIGHSERRKNFAESNETIAKKVELALKEEILPIVCVSQTEEVKSLETLVPQIKQTGMLLYEPLFAIGSGLADSPENANQKAKEFQTIIPQIPILYGGSVTSENVAGFIKQEHLAGVGVGGASLSAETFYNLILNAQTN